ncbi:MAG: response regulator transcription factor [Solimonas sp.]
MSDAQAVKGYGISVHSADARRVLVADDDYDLSQLLEFALRKSGFDVEIVNSGKAALQAVKHSYFSLLLLDIEMPEPNGLVVCERVRSLSTVPILILSARNQENDLIDALDAGADGFIVKPFGLRALLARIHALLRRAAETESDAAQDSQQIQTGEFRLEIEERLLHTRRQKIPLTRLETVVLRLLMQSADQPVDFKLLVAEAWGPFNMGNRNMLKQVVFRLRRKLESDPDALRSLVTTAEGYCWESGVSGSHLSDVENPTGHLC